MTKYRLCFIVVASQFVLLSPALMAGEVAFSLHFKTVGDRVAYTPNLLEGGFAAPQNESRFNETEVTADWQVTDNLALHTAFGSREFITLRDQFQFNYGRVDLSYHASAYSRGTFLHFGMSSNRADSLNKNSYTDVNGAVIRSLTINSPRDSQFELGLEHRFSFNSELSLSPFGFIGRVDTSHSGVSGNLKRGNCEYDFAFGQTGGEVQQIDTCGSITSLVRRYPSDETVDSDFGVSPVKDLRNKATFIRLGVQLDKSFGKWALTSSYTIQKYFREALDERISQQGGTVQDSNQVLQMSATYQVNNSLSVSSSAEYHLQRYMNEVPVLYTSFTSARFDNAAVFLRFSISYELDM